MPTNESHQQKIEWIFNVTIGDDFAPLTRPEQMGYGSEDEFIRQNIMWGTLYSVLRKRVMILRKNHKDEAEEVLKMWSKKYPRTYAILNR